MDRKEQDNTDERKLRVELKRLESTNKPGAADQLLSITSSRSRKLSEAGARLAYQEELERFRSKLNNLFASDP